MRTIFSLIRLYPSIEEHQRVEAIHLELLNKFLDQRYIAPHAKPLRKLRYAQKNFFSILFLAAYRAIGIPEERRILYGVINHAIRGIVTAADNILDDEYKEMLPLRFAPNATRFKSIMHILVFDRILYHIADTAVEQGLISPTNRDKVLQSIFAALIPIGEEEATEEKGVAEIFTPQRIIEEIHIHKGGNLLRLAFVTPLLIETDLRERVVRADKGVFRIGLALQAIDDLTDFYDDLRDRHHNYLVSSIHHEGNDKERQHLGRTMAGSSERPPIEEAYAESVRRVMGRAVGEALKGFALLQEAGFWLNRRQALELIRRLFKLRGVGNLLPLLPVQEIDHMGLLND